MKEGPIGFAANTKTRGKSEGRPWGASNFPFPNEKWLSDGFVLFQHNAGGFPRDFWVGRHLVSESELGFRNQVPAYRSRANKMMSILLFLAEHPEDRGIRHRSLKVATISVLMGKLSRERQTCLN